MLNFLGPTKRKKKASRRYPLGLPIYAKGRYSNPMVKPITNRKPRKSPPSFIQSPIKNKNMNWAQAKWKYPKMKPMGDRDGDGVKNMFDCKPLNKKRHMAYVRTDGGRTKDGMADCKRGDCFIRALAVAEKRPYKEIYKEVQKEFDGMDGLKNSYGGYHYRRGKKVRSSVEKGVMQQHVIEVMEKRG